MTTVSESFKTYSRDAKVPVFKNGRPNPQAYGQLSAGSIFGRLDFLFGEYVGNVLGVVVRWSEKREWIRERLEQESG